MKLPAKCPHRRSRKNYKAEDAETCCRGGHDGDIQVLLPKEEPFCRSSKHCQEEYRFIWQSSFHGDALVHVSRGQTLSGEMTNQLQWAMDGTFPAGSGRFWKSIDESEWKQIESAVLAAGFWAAPEWEDESTFIVLDGASWFIEGRRGDVYRRIRRHSPEGAIYNLCRLLLDIAGPPVAEIRLY